MQEKIRALLFDFTRNNLDADELAKINMTSGRNVLNDVIQFEDGEFSDSPFVQLIEIECEIGSHDIVRNEQMSNILGINKNNLYFYCIYTRAFKGACSFTMNCLSKGSPGALNILANKSMFERAVSIFEIRFKNRGEWSAWQAIAGKFIVAQNYRFGSGGIAEAYSSMTEREIEIFKLNFQIRYSGSIISEMIMPNTLPRIMNDPFNSDIRKIIDPNTFEILFDSQIIQEISSEKSCEVWRKFEERYK